MEQQHIYTHGRLLEKACTRSTNDDLMLLVRQETLPEFTAIVAHEQTAGRGQPGNSWHAKPGKNLLVSLLLKPHFLPVSRQFLLSQCVALGIVQVLQEQVQGVSIKWPNDIYVGDKKIAGMLIENSCTAGSIEACVVGLGLNLNERDFPPTLPNPVSLSQLTGQEYNPIAVLQALTQGIKNYYLPLREQGETVWARIAEDYQKHLYRRHGMHRYKDAEGEFTASIIGVEADGRLVLKDNFGLTRSYLFKEVEYLL